MPLDPATLDAFESLFAESVARGPASPIEYRLAAPKWQFLCYLCEQKDVALHGSNDPNISRLVPRKSKDVDPFGDREAVYATIRSRWVSAPTLTPAASPGSTSSTARSSDGWTHSCSNCRAVRAGGHTNHITAHIRGDEMPSSAPQTGYAPVNGLNLYYEIHGTGQPLVVLHGSFMTIELMGAIVPELARSRQVIAVEFQGHGHTADVDRPITYEHLADDTAALVRHLGIAQADIYGYSLGGGVALQVAIRHPEVVRKLVIVSASYTSDGNHPEVLPAIEQIKPELFDGTPWRDAYNRTAPDPSAFPTLVEKNVRLDSRPFDWSAEAVRSLAAPTLLVFGDSDGTRLDHVVELFRLRGGGVFGDLAGLPASQLAILPGTSHVGILDRTNLLLLIVTPFLDAPMPEPA